MTAPKTRVIGAHIHAPATEKENAEIVIDFGQFGSLDSPIRGSTTVDNQLRNYLIEGLAYVNIHSLENPGGEFRGQILIDRIDESVAKFKVNLNSRNEVPPIQSNASGKGSLELNLDTGLLVWNIDYGNGNLQTRSHGPGDLPPEITFPPYAKEF